MSKNANTPEPPPQIAGLGERQMATQEQSIAHAHFAGVALLKVVWVMAPIDMFSRETDKFKAPKNFAQPLMTFTSGSFDPFAPIDGFSLPGFKS